MRSTKLWLLAAAIALATAGPARSQISAGSTMSPPPVVRSMGQPQAHPVPVPDVPQPPPGIYSSNPPPGLPAYAPTPTVPIGQYSPPPAPSPITNYGPGGIAPIPGAPANPPYSTGGFAIDRHD